MICKLCCHYDKSFIEKPCANCEHNNVRESLFQYDHSGNDDFDELLNVIEWFCDRVERGEVRSVRTYTRFKGLLIKHGRRTE